MDTKDLSTQTVEKLLKVCEYSHDGDFAVYEEKGCKCTLCKCGDSFFIRREFKERRDYKEISSYFEDIPIDVADLDMGKKSFSAKYCNGKDDNDWILVYNIHKDADKDTGPAINTLIKK